MKKLLKIMAALLVILTIAIGTFLATFKFPQHTDYGTYTELYTWTSTQFEQMQKRPVSAYFENFSVPLGFPFNKILGAPALGVQLTSFENEQLSAATVSMFELPPGSGYHGVYTLNLVPRHGFRAPVMHVDFMKPTPGVGGMFILDFFNVDTKAISYEQFFGNDIAIIEQALATVEQYQRTEEQGRGKISRHLDPYKSPYRIELREPKTDDDTIRRAYYTAARDTVMMVLPVYLKRIALLQQDQDFSHSHEQSMQDLTNELYAKDFAIKTGRFIFKEHFAKYWAEGFWSIEPGK